MKIKTDAPLLEYTATSTYDTLQKATQAMCKHKSAGGKIGLSFSMFETNKDDQGDINNWIVNHPDIWSDEPVFEGNVVFFSDYWRIAEEPVYSEVMPRPRWEEIINEAGRQLIDPEDQSTACLFLEGFDELEPRSDGTRVIELVWGS
jgi:hypothetical protein